MAVSFANIFKAEIETKRKPRKVKPTTWKRFIDDAFSQRNVDKQEINLFIAQAKTFHPTNKVGKEGNHFPRQESALPSTSSHVISRQKSSNTRILLLVTRQVLKGFYQKRGRYVSSNKLFKNNIWGSTISIKNPPWRARLGLKHLIDRTSSEVIFFFLEGSRHLKKVKKLATKSYHQCVTTYNPEVLQYWCTTGVSFKTSHCWQTRTLGSVGWSPSCHAGGREFDSGRTNTQGL